MAGDEPSWSSARELGRDAAGGQLRTIAWHNTVLRDADGTITGTLSSGEDVTERLAAEQQITYLAYHDALTGLPNRTLLEEHLELALARARRTGAGVALLHARPRQLQARQRLARPRRRRRADLPRSTARLQRVDRAPPTCSPAPAATASCVLLADLHDDPLAAAERVGGADRRARSPSRSWSPAPSSRSRRRSGSRSTPRDARDAEALLAHADAAMYRAKETARGGWAVYAPAGRDPLERLSMAARLRRALVAEEFELHYQPIFDAPAASSSASRRCCAGTTPSAAGWCRRASSSRSPRRPA